MNAWLNLFKKEWRMLRNILLISLAALAGAGLYLYYRSMGYHLGIVMAPASLLVIFALFTPAIYMFSSVAKELKQTAHLWLHSPQPAWMLLSTKLVVAVAFMLIVLLLDAGFVFLTIFTQDIPQQTGFTPQQITWFLLEAGTYGLLTLLGVSLYMASWSTLVVVATAAVRNALGRFKGLVGLAVFLAGTWGMGKVVDSAPFEGLTHWGAIPIRLHSLKQFIPAEHYANGPEIYAGLILAFTLITLALFALSAWLIDNKVEV